MPNRLAHASSPYLQQHADNPVDWYPWGPEALERARAERRPILLSVGYSACHWCHVMEHESFSDAETADLMNASFVNVKVDREERPDLDELYMRAVQAFTGGHGGWPMTVFLTPEGEPFFAGTYFPPESRHGMPSFRQVLAHASRTFAAIEAGEEDVHERAAAVLRDASTPEGETGRDDWLEAVVQAAERSFDARQGGFGGAPRFPPHGTLAVLLADAALTGRARSRRMATTLLDAMMRGGMYDHLEGGFARYSVDGDWRIPHFEKMLYDNAQLLPLYADAAVLTGDAAYERIARETADYLLGFLRSPEGLFQAAEDADAEGEEGRHAVWTPAQLGEALGAEDGARAARLLEVTSDGTFEHGTSVLRLAEPLERMDADDAAFLREVAFPALRAVRARRTRPHRDDKVITSWNGLAIRGLARAGRTLGGDLVEAAATAASGLLERARPGGRLHRILTPEGPRIPGFLDDYANLIGGLLALWEATWAPRWLEAATELADDMLARFADPDGGALFYTGDDAERLLARSHKLVAGAEPSGNGAAALHLAHLAALTGRRDLGEAADRILEAYAGYLARAPMALGEEALAGHWRSRGGIEVGLVGEPGTDALTALEATLARRVLPFAATARVAPGQTPPVPWMHERGRLPGAEATAYVCEGFSCRLPVADPEGLVEQLELVLGDSRTEGSPEDAAGSAGPAPRSRHLVRAPAWSTDPDAWLNTDRPLSLEDLRGHVVVLDFWTFCCINCLHVLPELEAVERRFEDEPVVVLGVHAAKFDHEKIKGEVARAVARHGIRHPVILDPDHALWQQYAVRSWPTVVVLDPHGRIALQRGGEIDRGTLGHEIATLLAEGRGQGVLAEQPVWRPRPVEATRPTGLRFPGKVRVAPGPRAQHEGADPLDDGRLFVADTGNHRILECRLQADPEGAPTATVLRTFGGPGEALRDGHPDEATFRDPQGLAPHDGALWVADTGHHALRRIDLETGRVTTAAGTGSLGDGTVLPEDPTGMALRSPWDVELAEGVVLMAMAGTHQIWIHLMEDGRTGPLLGSGREAHVDGDPQEAALAQPSALRLWGHLLFFVDSETSSVRAYDFEAKRVGTLVGEGLFDFGDVDGSDPRAVRLQHPLGLAVAANHVFVADTYNGKVKRIELPGGVTRTVAGGLTEPGGLDVAGPWLVVADTGAHRLVAVHRETGEVRPLPIAGIDQA